MYDMYPTEWGTAGGDDAGASHPGTEPSGPGEPTERPDDS